MLRDARAGQRIRTARELAGLSVRELADLVQRTPLTIYRWESGQNRPSVPDSRVLCDVLLCDPVWLLTGRGKKPTARAPNPDPLPRLRANPDRDERERAKKEQDGV